MMPKLILHIGAHKTGTTALQNFLALNYRKLLEYGVLYPKFGADEMVPHHIILRPLVTPKPDDYIWSITGAEHIKSEDDIKVALSRELEETGAHTVIVSTESLFANQQIFDNAVATNKAGYARQLFSEYNVEVVVYLRNQADWLESCYVEAVKGAHTCFDGGVKDYILYKHHEYLDYRGYLEPWYEAFGKDKIHVRLYENVGKKIETDFLVASGLTFPESADWAYPGFDDANQSLNHVAVRLLRQFNKINRALPLGWKYKFPFSWDDLRKFELLGRQPYLSHTERQKLFEDLDEANTALFANVEMGDEAKDIWREAFFRKAAGGVRDDNNELEDALGVVLKHSSLLGVERDAAYQKRDTAFQERDTAFQERDTAFQERDTSNVLANRYREENERLAKENAECKDLMKPFLPFLRLARAIRRNIGRLIR